MRSYRPRWAQSASTSASPTQTCQSVKFLVWFSLYKSLKGMIPKPIKLIAQTWQILALLSIEPYGPHPTAQDMMLFLVWDEESEEHLDSTILSNSHQTVDGGKHGKSESSDGSSSEDWVGFTSHGGSFCSPILWSLSQVHSTSIRPTFCMYNDS